MFINSVFCKILILLCLSFSQQVKSQSVEEISVSIRQTVSEMATSWTKVKDEESVKIVSDTSMQLAKKLTELSLQLEKLPLPDKQTRETLGAIHKKFSDEKGEEMAKTVTVIMARGDLMALFSKEMRKLQAELNKSKPIFDRYFPATKSQ